MQVEADAQMVDRLVKIALGSRVPQVMSSLQADLVRLGVCAHVFDASTACEVLTTFGQALQPHGPTRTIMLNHGHASEGKKLHIYGPRCHGGYWKVGHQNTSTMGKHHNGYEQGLVALMLHYRNAREGRKQTLKQQSAKLYIGALLAINGNAPLTTLEFLRTNKAAIEEQIKAAPLATGKNWAAAAATVLYALITSGNGTGLIQRDYYRLSQRLSKQQQVEQAANPGLSDAQREKWASMQEVEDAVVAPWRRLLDRAEIGRRPLTEMGMAEFLLARSSFLIMSFVGQPTPRPSSLAPLRTIAEYSARGMSKDKNWLVLAGPKAFTVVFNVHKTMNPHPQIVSDGASSMFSRYREALHLYLPLRNKLLGLAATSTQSAPLYISSQDKQMTAHDIGKELFQTTETALGKRVGARMLRTVFASSMFQACAYSDSGIGLVEAAKRLGHSVKTALVSYVKRVDDPRLSLATPLRPAAPAPMAAAMPIAPAPPTAAATVTRVTPLSLAAAVSGLTPQPTTLRGKGRSKPIGSRSPRRHAKSISPTRPTHHSSAKGQEAAKSPPRMANRRGRQRQPPLSEDVNTRTSQRATRSPSRTTPSPRRSRYALTGGKGQANLRSAELWHLPLRPFAANLSIANLGLQQKRA